VPVQLHTVEFSGLRGESIGLRSVSGQRHVPALGPGGDLGVHLAIESITSRIALPLVSSLVRLDPVVHRYLLGWDADRRSTR
jgi:hypothetical protein